MADLKFILEPNLGKLAKLLRFLGYDASLYNHTSFDNKVRIATKENRLYLTRTKKHKNTKVGCLKKLIISVKPEEQLQELRAMLTFNEEKLFTRCSQCNKELFNINKEKVFALVPEYIYENNSDFKICRKCGKIYWKGNHYHDIKKQLKLLLEV